MDSPRAECFVRGSPSGSALSHPKTCPWPSFRSASQPCTAEPRPTLVALGYREARPVRLVAEPWSARASSAGSVRCSRTGFSLRPAAMAAPARPAWALPAIPKPVDDVSDADQGASSRARPPSPGPAPQPGVAADVAGVALVDHGADVFEKRLLHFLVETSPTPRVRKIAALGRRTKVAPATP